MHCTALLCSTLLYRVSQRCTRWSASRCCEMLPSGRWDKDMSSTADMTHLQQCKEVKTRGKKGKV